MKRALINIIIFLITLISGLVILELYYQSIELNLAYHKLDPSFGKMLAANQRINYFSEGFYLGESNDSSYLGNPVSKTKSAGKIRISLIGDSYIEGFHLMEKHHLGSILEEQLEESIPGTGVEVLNFGNSGFKYDQMLIYYIEEVKEYNSDIVLFFVAPFDFVPQKHLNQSPKIVLKHGEIEIDRSFTHSEFYQAINQFKFIFNNSTILKTFILVWRKADRNIRKFTNRDLGNSVKALNHKRHSIKEEMCRPDNIERITQSFDWLNEDPVVFILTKEHPVLTDLLNKNDITYISVSNYLSTQRKRLGYEEEHDYWKVTNMNGHWNHNTHHDLADTLSKYLSKKMVE